MNAKRSRGFFWPCLILCTVWVGQILQTPFLHQVELLPLFAALLMAGTGAVLLWWRRWEPTACLTALLLCLMGVITRDNTAGFATFTPFPRAPLTETNTTFPFLPLLWGVLMGIVPFLFAQQPLHRPLPSETKPNSPVGLHLLLLLLGIAVTVGMALWDPLHLAALPLQPLTSFYHILLFYMLPLLLLQQIFLFQRLGRRYRQEKHPHDKIWGLFHLLNALFLASIILNDLLISSWSLVLTQFLAYLPSLCLLYGMERHRLLEIQIVLSRAAQFAFLRQVITSFAILPLLLLSFWAGTLLNTRTLPSQSFPALLDYLRINLPHSGIAALAISTLLLALRVPLFRWLEGTYFREVYDAQRVLEGVGHSLFGLSNPQEIGQIALRGVEETLHPLCALLLAREGTAVVCLATQNVAMPLDSDIPLAGLFALSEIQEAYGGLPGGTVSRWASTLDPTIGTTLDTMQIDLVVPLHREEETVAILLLGEKVSGFPYTPEDRQLLAALASQISLALHTARLNQEFLRRQTEELTMGSVGYIELVERERRLLAADLHDQTLPELRGLLTDLEYLPNPAPASTSEGEAITMPNVGRATPAEMTASLRQTIQNIRDIMESLRPSALEMLGLWPAIEGELRKSVARVRPPLIPQFRLDPNVEPPHWDAFTEMSVFRIAQEAVNNACRHAEARTVRVTLSQEGDEWVLRVEDDGKGLSSPENRPQGRGLDNILYRANLIGATVSWGTPDWSQGTRVELRR